MYILGFDIGGTKCAAVTAEYDGKKIKLLKEVVTATDHKIGAYQMLDRLTSIADGIIERIPDRIGISCGGPLDLERGVIINPPNLPSWNNIEITKYIEERYGVKTKLQNDANACAVAEWKFGAGVGCRNMIFMTFGTGLGAGLILDGKLYEGTNGNAGEIGHIRLASSGPVGYGKEGSFEGFCSGGGIARLGYIEALKALSRGEHPLYYTQGMSENDITAKSIALAAKKGDSTAIEVYRISGKYLGMGLATLIDILNPEIIVIGSIFSRSKDLMIKSMKNELEREALPLSAKSCKIVAAKLGEALGNYAAVATALT